MAARKIITVTSAADYGQWWVKIDPDVVCKVARDMRFSPTSRQDHRMVYVSEDDFPEFKERARTAGIVVKVDPNIEFFDGWSPIRDFGMVDPTVDRAYDIGSEVILADGRRAIITDRIEVAEADG